MKKWLALTLAGGMGLVLCTACGDGEEIKNTSEGIYGEMLESSSGTEAEKETMTETGTDQEQGQGQERKSEPEPNLVNMTLGECKELAASYLERGLVKRGRDVLELCWMRYGDVESFQKLQDVYVNVAEESEEIQEKAGTPLQNLELEEYRSEAAATISSPEWFQTMMPRLLEGKRCYYLENQNSGAVMLWQTGYDGPGETDTSVWYLNGGNVIFLRRAQDFLLMVQAERSEAGVYQGAFDAWSCDGKTGTALHETGTLQNGLLNGAFTAQAHMGDGEADLFVLWLSRQNLVYTSYRGDFNSDGTAAVKQLEKKEMKGLKGTQEGMDQVIYAYTEDEENFLFRNVPEGTNAAEVPFEAKLLGLSDLPEWTSYEPVEQGGLNASDSGEDQMIRASDVEVRVYGGNLEWFDGTKWHTLGPAMEYVNQDPLGGYTGRQSEVPEEENKTEGWGGLLQEGLGSGQVKEATSTAPSTTRPSNSSKPSTPASSASAPAPSASAPAPSASAPQTPPPSEPAPTPSASAPQTPPPSEPASTPSESVPQTPPSSEPAPTPSESVPQTPPSSEPAPSESAPPSSEPAPSESVPPSSEPAPSESVPPSSEPAPAPSESAPSQTPPSTGDGQDMWGPDLL